MSLFIDASFWIALANARDAYHALALDWAAATTARPTPLITTEAVLWETLNSLSPVPQRNLAAELHRRVHNDPRIAVVGFEPDLCDEAVRLYAERPDKDWGVVDCLSFVVMKRYGISQSLTSDHHFEQAGFDALLRGEVWDDIGG